MKAPLVDVFKLCMALLLWAQTSLWAEISLQVRMHGESFRDTWFGTHCWATQGKKSRSKLSRRPARSSLRTSTQFSSSAASAKAITLPAHGVPVSPQNHSLCPITTPTLRTSKPDHRLTLTPYCTKLP